MFLSPQDRIWTLLDVVQKNADGSASKAKIKPDLLKTYQYLKQEGRTRMAKAIMADLFTIEERVTSNCRGSLGKPPLDPIRLEAVRQAVFELLPCEESQMEAVWCSCVTCIDTANRGLKRRKYFQDAE